MEDTSSKGISNLRTHVSKLRGSSNEDPFFKALAESILTASVAAGWHSIDVSLIIAPAMHEHIISIANEAGVDCSDILRTISLFIIL